MGHITVATLKIGIQTRSLRQPLRRALETAAGFGADGVEIDARTELLPVQMSQTATRQFRKILGDLNLRVSAVSFMTRRGYDVADDLERRVLATQAAMKFAQAIGAGVVVNRVGQVPESADDPSFRRLIEALTALGAYGDRVGARLAAQTSTESGPRLATLLNALPASTIGIDLHPSALIHHGHDPEEAVRALGPAILHVHACDAVRAGGQGTARDVELGRGSADVPNLLAHLEEFNYGGWFTIERQNAADPTTEIGNAVAYLRSL